MDLDWVHQGGQNPLALLREAGPRVEEIHVRNSKNKLWLEAVEDGDVDYRKIAAYLKQSGLKPLIVVELAYRPNTVVTRPLEEDSAQPYLHREGIRSERTGLACCRRQLRPTAALVKNSRGARFIVLLPVFSRQSRKPKR